jgi:hypothetical protein
VINGVAQSECIPPDESLSDEAQAIRLLSIITGRTFTTIGSAEQALLDAGEYKSPDGSMQVTFKLPRAGSTGGGAGMRAA